MSQDMPSKDKVFRLGNIAAGLRKKVTKSEEQRKPNKPPKVLERRRDTTTHAAKIIEEAEQTCAKDVDQVSLSWESLMDDEKS